MFFLNKKRVSGVGIDIGTKVIKMVELSKKNNNIILTNYGEVNLDFACDESFRSFSNSGLEPQIENISIAIKELMDEARADRKSVIFSLPDFATFFSSFQMPPMTKKEIDNAITFEAKKYIPLPLDEIFLDWQTSDNKISEKEVNKILVTAVPKKTVASYREIAVKSQLSLVAAEPEAFSLKRAVKKDLSGSDCLVEIGFQSTNVSIIQDGQMKMSFSFDIAGKNILNSITKKLEVDNDVAEKMKSKYGLLEMEDLSVREAILPVVSDIVRNIDDIIRNFEKKENFSLQKIILFGGSSLIPGISEYMDEKINSRRDNKIIVEIGKPFNHIAYPAEIEEKMKEMNANYAIALGLALKFFE